MRTADFVRAMLATAAATALVTGCTSGTEESTTGTAAPTTAGLIEVFNPCTGLPDRVLTEVGLNPATKTIVTDAPEAESSWRVCGWRTPDDLIRVDILSTSHTLDEARSNENLVQKVETTVGSRPALRSYDKSETDGRSCYISMGAEQGMFEIGASWFEEDGWTRDICELSSEFAAALDPHLPK
ncbi:DUF3558 domain-containing protein [Nocardia jinanensis]|uniref:DUF3558 domain-containing protein n=1 Tax=Nocardia jinanensis TaxID=382504 RepID=A0A917VZU3_9NOCA|nr:DUF3558 domain-containing protein [Nocardia jinanensis]GGL45113.1 hypothetical protein GCM10011588_69740 [Nocardia jinanensis]